MEELIEYGILVHNEEKGKCGELRCLDTRGNRLPAEVPVFWVQRVCCWFPGGPFFSHSSLFATFLMSLRLLATVVCLSV